MGDSSFRFASFGMTRMVVMDVGDGAAEPPRLPHPLQIAGVIPNAVRNL